MSDFQSFLDENLAQIAIQTDRVAEERYEYNIDREICNMVVKARDEAGLTQKQLSEKSGLTQSNISNIEKGISRPTVESLKKIADAVGKRLVVDFIDREEMI